MPELGLEETLSAKNGGVLIRADLRGFGFSASPVATSPGSSNKPGPSNEPWDTPTRVSLFKGAGLLSLSSMSSSLRLPACGAPPELLLLLEDEDSSTSASAGLESGSNAASSAAMTIITILLIRSLLAYLKPKVKGLATWTCGMFLGKTLKSDLFIFGTGGGLFLTRSIRRLPGPLFSLEEAGKVEKCVWDFGFADLGGKLVMSKEGRKPLMSSMMGLRPIVDRLSKGCQPPLIL